MKFTHCWKFIKEGQVDKGWNPFDDAYIFRNRVYVGNNDKIVIVDLSKLDYRVVDCEMYFGYFYEYGNLLFVATGVNLMCFQENGEIKWKTEMLAVDGVTFGGARRINVKLLKDE